MTIDNELKACAAMALQNAFYRALSALVATYRTAAAGLGNDLESGQAFADMSSWGDNADLQLVQHDKLNLYVMWPSDWPFSGSKGSCGHDNFIEAFEDGRAQEVWIDGTKLFVRGADGAWCAAPVREGA